MQVSLADVQLKVMPKAEVNVGETVILTCQYQMLETSAFEVSWKHGQDLIWVYNGTSDKDSRGAILKNKSAEIFETNRKHSIRLYNMNISDEGLYTCIVEDNGGSYVHKNASLNISVVGMRMQLFHIKHVSYN